MSLLTLNELESELGRGNFQPVYLVTGEESYLVRLAIKMLKERVVAADELAFNYTEICAEEDSAAEILEAANTYPMMARHRLVLVTNAEKIATKGQEALIGYLENPAAKCVLVLHDAEIDRRTAFFRKLKEKASVVDCPRLKGEALARWADQFVRKAGYRIASPALNNLMELAGSDIQSLASEIEKLLLYAGPDKTIDIAAVDELVRSSRQRTIFDLTGAIGKRDRQGALILLGKLLEGDYAPLLILSMLGRQFRQMLIAKEMVVQGRNEREIAQAAQIPAFLAGEFVKQIRSIDRQSIENMYVRLANIDHSIKSSGVNERMVLESLMCSL